MRGSAGQNSLPVGTAILRTLAGAPLHFAGDGRSRLPRTFPPRFSINRSAGGVVTTSPNLKSTGGWMAMGSGSLAMQACLGRHGGFLYYGVSFRWVAPTCPPERLKG